LVSERARSIVALAVAAIVAIVAVAASVFFFMESVGLLARDTPYVTASLLSALIGVALLSAATNVTRTLLLARAAEKLEAEMIASAISKGRRESGKGKEKS